MPVAIACLLGFVAWTLALVVGIAAVRISLILTGQARITAFPANQPHGGARYQRLLRAHLNCVENLPLLASVVLAAHALGTALPAHAPPIYLAARVMQSCIHVASGRGIAINLRFVCFATQIGCLVVMGLALLPQS